MFLCKSCKRFAEGWKKVVGNLVADHLSSKSAGGQSLAWGSSVVSGITKGSAGGSKCLQ